MNNKLTVSEEFEEYLIFKILKRIMPNGEFWTKLNLPEWSNTYNCSPDVIIQIIKEMFNLSLIDICKRNESYHIRTMIDESLFKLLFGKGE